MKELRITVIMGIYNCSSTLTEALDSLIAQTYQGFKVVMCDDGSTDDTYRVAQTYVDRYPQRFTLIKNSENRGLGHALNRCLELADTEYVARMDGDDISLPNRFEVEISFLDAHPEYAIVSCPIIQFDENGDFRVGRGCGEVTKADFIHGTPFPHAPCIIRKEAYTAVNGYSQAKRHLRVEDIQLWVKLYDAGFRGYNLEKPLYKMRDDKRAARRRTWSNRVNEMRVRNYAISRLNLPAYARLFTLRPILVYLLPKFIYNYFHYKS